MEQNKKNYIPLWLFSLLTFLLLFACLGSREIWTQEWRWGEIVRWMLLHNDYFHPVLAGQLYFDKPLLSYWLMVGFTKLMGLSTFAIRLPSAIAGLTSIFCIYQIGKQWIQKEAGYLAALMLTTTYYFIFWARTASADALNLAGILATLAWYFTKRNEFNLKNSSIFFTLLAITALFKGLIGIIIVFIIVAPDLLHLKTYDRKTLLISLLLGILVYFLPFLITGMTNNTSLIDSGLYDVYRENILRFFIPFDHEDPISTYFIYLPIYLLPWTLFFLIAIYKLPFRWQTVTLSTKQLVFANLLLFTFLTLSGSRRSYYILPQVPFALLLTAEWWMSIPVKTRTKWVSLIAKFSFCGLLIWFVLLQPFYYSGGGLRWFSQQLRPIIEKAPYKNCTLLFFDVDNRLSFYLPHSEIVFLAPEETEKFHRLLTPTSDQCTLLITRETELHNIQALNHYHVLRMQLHRGNRWLHHEVPDAPVALIPVSPYPTLHPSVASTGKDFIESLNRK